MNGGGCRREWRRIGGASLALALLVAAAPGAERTISPPGAEDLSPFWSPDGAHIACLTKAGGRTRLCLMAPDGSSREVLSAPAGEAVRCVWGLEDTRLALEVVAQNGPEVWLVRPEMKRVGAGREPAFSPDGRWLAYAADAALLLFDLREGRSRTLVSGARNTGFANPTWVPDSGRVFYASDGSLWEAAVEGGAEPRVFLRKDRYPYRQVIFSPSGGKALIVGDSSVATGEQAGDPLWLAGPDGANPARLLAGYSPRWLPGGDGILCSRLNELLVLDGRGGKVRVAAGRAPSASPDGARVACERMVAEGEEDDLFGAAKKSKIVVVDLDVQAAARVRGQIAFAWTVRLPAAVDVGLRDRIDPVARVTLDLPAALRKARTGSRVQPESLRVYEERDGRWVEVPSGIYGDAGSPELHEVLWLLPGKREMLTEPQYMLCFLPEDVRLPWRRPGRWQGLALRGARRNLIPNPGLEQVEGDRPRAWQAVSPRDPAAGGVSLETENVFRGKRCLRLTAAAKTVNPGWRSAVFELEEKKDYLVGFAVRCDISEGHHPIVWLYYLDGAGKPVCDDIMVHRKGIRQPPKSLLWQRVEERVRTPAGTAQGQLRVVLYRSLGSGWLDHFSIAPFARRDDVRVIVGAGAGRE